MSAEERTLTQEERALIQRLISDARFLKFERLAEIRNQMALLPEQAESSKINQEILQDQIAELRALSEKITGQN